MANAPHRPSTPQPSRPLAAHVERRGDIEGLRAVAVVLVLLFHAQIAGFGGGFVGVDVFFVVSGFLITGLLLRERERTGTISLASFYARRARRLLPAAALVLLVTLVLSARFLPPLLLPQVATDSAAAALYVSNIGFAVQATDYFSAGQAPSPILHFWSLGVEEQFYLFWPTLVLLVSAGAARPRRRVGAAIVAIALVSFAFAIWLTGVAEPWAFFSLPSRAWELGLGGILAVAGSRLAVVPRRIAGVAGWLGLGLIAYAGVAIDASTPFPGSVALLPTVGAALVILAGSRADRVGPARFLAARVPQFLGRISYSLYLWHWPVLVIPAVAAGAPLPFSERVSLVLIAIVLATATNRWLEDPVRRGRLVGTLPRRNLAMAAALTVVVALVSVSVDAYASSLEAHPVPATTVASNTKELDAILNGLAGSPHDPASGSAASPASPAARPGATVGPTGASGRAPGASPTSAPTPIPAPARKPTKDGPVPADLQPSVWAARNDYPESYLDRCHTQQELPPSSAPCLYGDLNSSTTIALFGDSHALAWFPAVERLAETHGLRLFSQTMSACSPADVTVWNANFGHVSTACATWRYTAFQRLTQAHPSIVIVAGTRGFDIAGPNGTVLAGAARLAAWQLGMTRTVDRLRTIAPQIVLIADTPESRVDPPVCLSQHPSSVLACATPVADALKPDWTQAERDLATKLDLGFVDPTLWLCPTAPCPVTLGNLLIYRDAGHMTATFSAALADRVWQALQTTLSDLPSSGSG